MITTANALEHAERLLALRELQKAQASFEAASEGADADRCAGGLWMMHMLQGNFAAAWQQSDAIRARGAADPHRLWNGESIDKRRVILRCLHGFGDAVQMFRYLPMLQQRCEQITVEVPPRLLEIAPYFQGMPDVITWGDGAPAKAPVWDVQIEIMELPYLFRTECVDLPLARRYLQLPNAIRDAAASLMRATKRRVGVVWSTGEWNRTRALPFDLVKRLTSDMDIEFWNLQGGDEHATWSTLPASPHLRDGMDAGDGILPLATLIDQMDLVITPDTLAAHLAGALGKPAWVLLQHAADWRWMHARADTPWYPTLRLFRQREQGDWSNVMQEVPAALKFWKETR